MKAEPFIWKFLISSLRETKEYFYNIYYLVL